MDFFNLTLNDFETLTNKTRYLSRSHPIYQLLILRISDLSFHLKTSSQTLNEVLFIWKNRSLNWTV